MLEFSRVRSGFLAVLVVAAACRREPPPPPAPEVALFATVGEPAATLLAGAAARAGVARVTAVTAPAGADVLWLGDPTEAVDAGELVAAGAAPDVPDVDERFRDPRGRFAPLCARARVLLLARGARLPFTPTNLRDLADPRLAGRVAVPPLGDGPNAAALAALSLAYGEASVERFLDLLARNAPRLAASEREVRALVARGDAAVGLAGTEEGAAGALSAAGLEVVFPDQAGRGAVVLPTAVAVTRAGLAKQGAHALAAFLAGAEAERLLAARVPGFMPLRAEVPVPEGVRPAGNVRALRLDWDRLADEKRRLAPALRRWPSQ